LKTSTATKTARPAKRAAKTTARRKTTAAKRAGKVESKADIIERMLTRATGTTRKALSEATGYPTVNLKMAAERAKKKLVEEDGRVYLRDKSE
jgi:hypothetical protein